MNCNMRAQSHVSNQYDKFHLLICVAKMKWRNFWGESGDRKPPESERDAAQELDRVRGYNGETRCVIRAVRSGVRLPDSNAYACPLHPNQPTSFVTCHRAGVANCAETGLIWTLTADVRQPKLPNNDREGVSWLLAEWPSNLMKHHNQTCKGA